LGLRNFAFYGQRNKLDCGQCRQSRLQNRFVQRSDLSFREREKSVRLYWGGGIFLSTDKGSSWTSENSGITGSVDCFAVKGDTTFAGAYRGGVFLSANNGASWIADGGGLPNTGNTYLAIGDSTLYAGIYGSGVWRRPLSEVTTGINNKGQILSQKSTGFKQTASAQSNRTIAISFSLAQAQPVSLKVYNLSGREISTLVNSSLGAGEHGLLWDTKGMAAGCYAAKMKVGSNVYLKIIIVSW
jgi:hypothetical protein